MYRHGGSAAFYQRSRFAVGAGEVRVGAIALPGWQRMEVQEESP